MKTINPVDDEAPLRAIRAFEAFAQHGNIGGAAEELAITPSAVSHQLRMLEQFLGATLTERRGRTLHLTEEGRSYYRSIHAALSILRNATNGVKEKSARRQIVIGVIPLFGTGWLNPRLGEFLSRNPDLDVSVRYAHHQSYLSDAADLSVRFGHGDWSGYRTTRLLPGTMSAVCSPALAERFGGFRTPEDLLRAPLVHDGDRARWPSWLALAGVEAESTPLPGPVFEDGLLTTSAVVNGLGVGLLRKALIQHELINGTLIRPFDTELETGEDYYLCVREDEEPPEAVQRVAQWIIRSVQSPGAHAPLLVNGQSINASH